MNVLFEDFVVAALREALGVSAREFPQGATGRRLRLDERGRITLKPDISLWEARGCVFVGDIKYKKINVEGIENPDIYQLLAYTVATELSCGLLIYAAGEEEPISHSVRSAGKRLEVVTLDLSASISDILLRVGSIASTIKRMRERAEKAPSAA